MVPTPTYPEKLQSLLDLLAMLEDRSDRIEMLIDIAGRYKPVPETIATPPYAEDHRVPGCESQAFVWAEPAENDSLRYYFAILNPQGISAQCMAVILDETLSGAPINEVARVSDEFVYDVFGRELSMGKSMGLQGMVNMVTALAKRRVAAGEA